jgi:flagellar hook-associated protein 2
MVDAITFTGLGSGIDLASIVTAMVDNEKKRFIEPIEEWKTGWEDKIEAFQDLNTKLASLHTTVKALDTQGEFFVKNATSSDTGVLTATADSSAINGAYSITVNQLAQAEKETHAGHADKDTTAVTNAAGTFSYTYNGQARSITVPAGTKLSQLVKLINNDPQNPGVTASVLDDGSGTATAHHLVLTGNTTGSSYTITGISHTLDNFSTGGTSGGGFSQTRAALNAQFRVDGYPAAGWIERSTNTISDAINGITFSLGAAASATITVATDTEAIKTKITDFISSFNEIRKYIKEITSYDTGENKAGILLGNYAVDTIKNKLNAIINTSPTGFRNGSDTYSTLMQLGIATDAESGSETEGLLTIDTAALNEALADNPQAVAELFSEYFSGRSVHPKMVYESYIDTITEAGTYEIKFIAGAPPTGQMRLKGTDTWHTAAWDNTAQTLTGTDGYPEAGLVVRITDTATGFTGEVDLKRGIAGDLKFELDRLTDADEGPLAVLETNYNAIIDSAEDKIAYEEKRIALYEQRLKERYARLEQVLTELNSQMSYMEARLKQLQK